jgi:hypothetical protein
MFNHPTSKLDFEKDYESYMIQLNIKCKCGNGIPRLVDVHDIPCQIFEEQCKNGKEFDKSRLYCENCSEYHSHKHAPVFIYKLIDEEMY